jgi:predicted nicotinamide N-methyase
VNPIPATPAEDFIRTYTRPGAAPHVPEITLYLASEITPIWQATETWLAENNVEPPFWAFAWPGSVALARHIFDNPSLVAGKRVLDFAAGGGIAAIACAQAGAAQVEAAEIDPLARAAIALNAALNHVDVQPLGDVIGTECRWDLIVCGDVCYDSGMTGHIMPWLTAMAAGTPNGAPMGTQVWIADPGRKYVPCHGLTPFGQYRIDTTLELEDRPHRDVTLYRLGGFPPPPNGVPLIRTPA